MIDSDFSKKIKVLQYKDAIDDTCFHINVKCKIKNQTISGFGSDWDQNIALIKAISEFFERMAFKTSKKKFLTSNGFACHTTKELSMSSALNELIERDIVSTRWLLKIPPMWIENRNLPDKLKKEQILARKKGYDIKYGLWGMRGKRVVTISIVFVHKKGPGSGFVLTSTCNFNFEKCTDSLILDNRRVITVLINRQKKNKKIYKNITESEIQKPKDAFDFYLNPRNASKVKWFLKSNKNLISEPNPKTDYNFFNNFQIKPPWELFVTKATSVDVQEYYVGSPKESIINFKRLSKFRKNLNKLNLNPNPLA